LTKTRASRSCGPNASDEYIGQKRVKENIQDCHRCGAEPRRSADHVLLYGPPGLGKPPGADIANELNVPIKTSAGPLLSAKGD